MTKQHGISVRCWDCGEVRDVRAISAAEAIPACCYDTLMDVSNAFGQAFLRQTPHHINRIVQQRVKFTDDLADAAVLSKNPQVRAEAQAWRNARAAQKKQE